MTRSGIAITTAETLAEHLRRLGIERGAKLVVHSSLISFGRIEGGAETVLRCLLEAVGPDGTLLFPTYTFDTADKPYDPRHSPSTNVGMLGETARRHEGAVRSRSAIHSHAGLGRLAPLLAETAADLSFGPGSDFDMMHRQGFDVVMLGCGFGACTFVHHVEAVAAVPYREWMTLQRRIVDPETGLESEIAFRYFGRKDDRWATRFEIVEQPLRDSGQLVETEAPYGRSFRAPLATLHDLARNMIYGDPYSLVITANAP